MFSCGPLSASASSAGSGCETQIIIKSKSIVYKIIEIVIDRNVHIGQWKVLWAQLVLVSPANNISSLE